jgi:hypothetical protein
MQSKHFAHSCFKENNIELKNNMVVKDVLTKSIHDDLGWISLST